MLVLVPTGVYRNGEMADHLEIEWRANIDCWMSAQSSVAIVVRSACVCSIAAELDGALRSIQYAY